MKILMTICSVMLLGLLSQGVLGQTNHSQNLHTGATFRLQATPKSKAVYQASRAIKLLPGFKVTKSDQFKASLGSVSSLQATQTQQLMIAVNAQQGFLRVRSVASTDNQSVTQWRLYNLDGELLKSQQSTTSSTSFDISGYQPGVYILHQIKNGLIVSKKFMYQ